MPAGHLMLDKSERGDAPNGTSTQAQLTVGPFDRRTSVFVTAHGTSHYQGPPTANAGIILTIRAGNHEIKDDSFEGESSNITFHATASHVFVMRGGVTEQVVAEVRPYGAGGEARNRNTQVDLHVIAIETP